MHFAGAILNIVIMCHESVLNNRSIFVIGCGFSPLFALIRSIKVCVFYCGRRFTVSVNLCFVTLINCVLRYKIWELNLTIHRVVSTGVEELDSVLGGGFPKGSLIVLAGSPGTGKTVFSARFLYHGAVNCGEKGIYVSLCEGKEIFMENMRGFGFDFEKLERGGMFRFLDMLTVKEKGISTILDMIIGEVEKFGAERLVLDSFSAMAHAFKDPIEARIIVHTILGKLIRGMGCTILLIKETGGNDVGKVFEAEEFVADDVIRFLATELEDQRLRSLEIIKLRGARLKEPRHVFTLDGGLKFSSLSRLNLLQKAANPSSHLQTGQANTPWAQRTWMNLWAAVCPNPLS